LKNAILFEKLQFNILQTKTYLDITIA